MDNLMELRVLEYFLATAKEQSIIKAAQSLHLSQPTLSMQIKALERELGKQLLIRRTKGSHKVTLSEGCMILKKRAEEILSLLDKTHREISISDDIIVGDVHIGTGETDVIRFIAKVAKKLCNDSPSISYHISSGKAGFVNEQLEKGLIDFGIVFGTVDLTKYNCIKLPYKDTWGVLIRNGCPLANKVVINVRDLFDKPLILSNKTDSQAILTS